MNKRKCFQCDKKITEGIQVHIIENKYYCWGDYVCADCAKNLDNNCIVIDTYKGVNNDKN